MDDDFHHLEADFGDECHDIAHVDGKLNDLDGETSDLRGNHDGSADRLIDLAHFDGPIPDRLVISNPGGLWGVSREQLGSPGAKSAVNEHLYDICTLVPTPSGARVIEGEGGGIAEAQRVLAQRLRHRPSPLRLV